MAKMSLILSFLILALAFASIIECDKVGVYELKRGDISLKLTNWGATVMSLIVPDKNGNLDDIVLGFDTPEEYKNDTVYFGAIVGRVANRIADAEFKLNGHVYKLVPNEGKNMLHGGLKGFSDVIWTVESHKVDSHITFTYNSYDGEQGFPGNLSVMVTYMFIGTNKLGIKMEAKALNKATPVNLAHHAYWNLHGHNTGNVLSHKIQIFGSAITPVDKNLIPTGKLEPVEGTPFDFRESQEIGHLINGLSDGYDINYVLDKSSPVHFRRAALLQDPGSGRKMELWTNQPGLQFYSSNMLHNLRGKNGAVYHKYAAVALETQGFPDSVNIPSFPSQILNPGEKYLHAMVYRFTAN